MFATEIGKVTDYELQQYRDLLTNAKWEVVPNRAYQTWDVTDKLPFYRAFFLKLPPHTALHKHIDAGDVQTDHVVIDTNPRCLNWWGDNECMHMKEGYRYKVDRTLLHWATNEGPTDRIHLLLEYR